VEQTNYAARLRYLDANDVDDSVVDYDALDVTGPDGDKLGDLDGFIVDAEAGRVYYIVIDTGGWFRTKQLLLPVGHATLDPDGKALRVDVTRGALGRYPDFERSRFQEFSDEDLRIFESRTVEACCPEEEPAASESPRQAWAYDSRKHYTQPGWWNTQSVGRGRASSTEPLTAGTAGTAAAIGAAPERIDRDPARDRLLAREGDEARRPAETRHRDTESPHYDGRAQPGDVLGIETGGERTHVGDTAEKEDERRRDAEKAAADDPPRQSER
jgi:hypothetical protein